MAAFSQADEVYMRRALALAMNPIAAPNPNPRVGCVIVREDKIIAEGCHEFAGSHHAEVVALKKCKFDARDAVMYVTLEPCATFGRTPPCTDQIIDSGVERVVIGTIDPNPQNGHIGVERLCSAGVKVDSGFLETEMRSLNRGFFSRYERGRAWVTVKVAATIDGRIATASGESTWITGEEARRDVQHWRAQASIVLTGIGTVLKDNPRLNCRLNGIKKQPTRVVVDSKLNIPVDAKLFEVEGEVCIAVANTTTDARSYLYSGKAEIQEFGNDKGQVDLTRLLEWLTENEANEVFVEAGPQLVGSLFAEKLVDELILYVAPSLLGDQAMGLARISGIKDLDDRIHGEFGDIRRLGEDIRLTIKF